MQGLVPITSPSTVSEKTSPAQGKSFSISAAIPFSIKIVIPSLIMICLVLFLGVSARNMVTKNLSHTIDIVNSAKTTNEILIEKKFKGAEKLQSVLSKVQKLNGTFFEILALQSSHQEVDASGSLLKLREDAVEIVKDLKIYNEQYADLHAKPVINDLVADIEKYYIGKNKDGIFDVSAMMIQIDLNLILQGMENYRKTFSKIQEKIEILTKDAMEDSLQLADRASVEMRVKTEEMEKESNENLSHMTNIFIISSVLSLVFSYIFSRLIAKSFRRMAIVFEGRATQIIQSLSQSAQQMEVIAEKVSLASKKTCSDSDAMAKSVLEARENVQAVAASSTQLAQSSSEISSQISNVADISSRAACEAERTHEKVKDLNDIAQAIGDVVGAIKAIAEQTNLLALNATIEAARAGSAGKGFAVVADEVKKLAVETSEKTEEVGDRVGKIQVAVKSTVEAMNKIIDEVRQIDNATTNVSGAVEEQSAATLEINRSVKHASDRTTQVMDTVSTVIDSAQENDRAASVVLHASKTLSQVSNDLRSNTQNFIQEILLSTR